MLHSSASGREREIQSHPAANWEGAAGCRARMSVKKKKKNIIHTKKSCLSLSPLFVFTMISGECRPERVCCDPHSTECSSSSSGTTEDRSLESDPDSLSSHSERRWRPAYVITQEEEEMGIIWQECRHHLRMQAERITQKTDAMASRETGMK